MLTGSTASKFVNDGAGAGIDRWVNRIGRRRSVVAAGRAGKACGDEVIDRGFGGGGERSELGRGTPVDGDDDSFARFGSPHDGGHVVA